MRYLQEHYADATLEHAAAYFNYSTSYFSRMVKHNTGCNFTELLVKYRLELACRLLRESRLKVGEICEIIGYRNLEHFNRRFGRNLTGRRPSIAGNIGVMSKKIKFKGENPGIKNVPVFVQ